MANKSTKKYTLAKVVQNQNGGNPIIHRLVGSPLTIGSAIRHLNPTNITTRVPAIVPLSPGVVATPGAVRVPDAVQYQPKVITTGRPMSPLAMLSPFSPIPNMVRVPDAVRYQPQVIKRDIIRLSPTQTVSDDTPVTATIRSPSHNVTFRATAPYKQWRDVLDATDDESASGTAPWGSTGVAPWGSTGVAGNWTWTGRGASNGTDVYSGSGVLVVEYIDGTNDNVILFRDASKGTYEDLGGRLDKRVFESSPNEHALALSAQKETAEESRALLRINNVENLPFVETTASNGSKYRCYILVVSRNVINAPDFNNNKAIVDASSAPPEWKETDDIQKIKLADIVRVVRNSGNITVNGFTISSRTKQCIQELVKNPALTSNPITLTRGSGFTGTIVLSN